MTVRRDDGARRQGQPPARFGEHVDQLELAQQKIDALWDWASEQLEGQVGSVELPQELVERFQQWAGLPPDEIMIQIAKELRSDLETCPAPFPTLAFLGPAGAGKSTIVNVLFGKPLAEIGAEAGTTTAPVRWSHRAGVDVLDTPGFFGPDDSVDEDVERLLPTLDIRVLVLDATSFRGVDSRLAHRLHQVAPFDFAVINKVDLPPAHELQLVVQQIRQHLPALPTVELSALEGRNFDTLIQALYQSLPDVGQQLLLLGWLNDRKAALASEIEALGAAHDVAVEGASRVLEEIQRARDRAAHQAIREAAAKAGAIGVTPIPAADVVPLMALQHRLIVRLAVIYGHERAYARLGAVFGPLAMSAIGRALFRQVLKVAGPAGDLAAGAVAAAGTYALGTTALRVFRDDLPPEHVEEILDEELARAYQRYRSTNEESP